VDVAVIEKALGEAVVDAGDQIAAALQLEPLGTVVLKTLQPILHDAAEAFVAAAEAGDSPEQFQARMAALIAKAS
jgi:hypothetical protein